MLLLYGIVDCLALPPSLPSPLCSVESLKRKLAKDAEMHRNDKARLMRENTQLTKEINMLRRELKHTKVLQTATQMGLTMDRDGELVPAGTVAPSGTSRTHGNTRNGV